MNVRTLKKQFGPGVDVSRDRKTRTVNIQSGALNYRADETQFSNEKELAEFAKSKLPANTLMPAR